MVREARKKSKSGIYHVVERGINRQNIFHDEEDCHRYLEIMKKVKKESECKVLGYCLMGNHVHLLIQEREESISKIMKKIGVSYAWWYNRKYERSGHVFQDRFKSECVEDDRYLMTVIRYIHQNPVKAGMVQKTEEYKWSSSRVYYGEKEYPDRLTEVSFILGLFNNDKEGKIEGFRKFIEEDNDDKCLDDNVSKRISDEKVCEEIRNMLNGKPINELSQMQKSERDRILRKAKNIEGSSLRQISRVTGISVNIVFKA